MEEEDEAQENAEMSVEDSQMESMGVKLQMRKKQPPNGGGQESLDQMRVNAVLNSHPAIEGYCYDLKYELWCEVSFHSVNTVLAHFFSACVPLLLEPRPFITRGLRTNNLGAKRQ